MHSYRVYKLIFITIISFILSLACLNASAVECVGIGFDVDNLWLKNFHGATTSDHKDTEGSLLIKDATPDSSREVTTSVEIIDKDNETSSIGFRWKKYEKNGIFFNLSFYVDDIFIEQYDNESNWDHVFFSEFESGPNRTHELKWILEYDPAIKYLERPPKGSAFIDDLEMCGLRFQEEGYKDDFEKSSSQETSTISSSKKIKKSDHLNKILESILYFPTFS